MADFRDRQARSHIFGGAHFYDHPDRARASVLEGARGDHPGRIGSPQPEGEFAAWYAQITFENRDTTPASTPSDTDMESVSATSPSALTAGSSVGTSEDTDSDVVMTDVPTPERPHEDIWPQVSNVDIPPRDPTIQDHDDPLHLAEDQMLPPQSKLLPQSLDPSVQGSPTPPPPRPRKLASPEKTSKVRNVGACLHCRIAKTECATHGPCTECDKLCKKWKAPDAREMCIRKTPFEVVGPLSSRWCLDTGRPPPTRFGTATASILVSFTDDASGPFLPVQVRQLEGRLDYGIRPDENPGLEANMLRWAEGRIETDVNNSFEASLDRFLVSLEKNDGIDRVCKGENADARSSSVESQKECVRRLVKMKCMWGVWSKQLYCRQYREEQARVMGSSAYFQPVEDYLHQLAGQAVSEAEKVVLREVDRLLAPISNRDKTLWSALNAVAWTSLWELMLIYRSTLTMFHDGQIGMTPTSTFFNSAKRTDFLATTGELYKNVAVLCSEVFRTKRALLSLEEAGKEVFSDEPFRFSHVWEARSAFYQSFRMEAPGDDLVKSLVVAKEGTVLGRKRTSKK